MHSICSRGMVNKEVVEARSNHKKSYLWIFRNPVCSYPTGSNQIENDRVCAPPGLVWEKGRKGVV